MFKRRIKRFFANKLKIHTLLLLAILAIGAYMILANLGSLSLLHDDVFHALSAEGILKYGYPRLPSGIIYPRGITQSYAIAFFSLFFGLNEFTVALPAALSGLGTIFLVYLLGKRIGGKHIGLIAAFAITFFPWHVEFSRWGRFWEILIFLMLLSLYSFIRGFLETNGSKFWKIISGISVILACLTSEAALSLVPLFLIIGLLYRGSFRLKKNLFWIVLFISAIPIARFFGEINAFFPTFSVMSGDSSPSVSHTMFGFLTEFLTGGYNHWLFNQFFYGVFSYFMIVIPCGAIVLLKTRDIDAKKALFFLLLFMLVLGPLLYYPTRHHIRSLYPTIPLVILLGLTSIGFIANFVFKIFTRNANNGTITIKRITTISLMMLLAFTVVNIPDSWNIHNEKYGDIWLKYTLGSKETWCYPDMRTISEYVLINKEPGDVVMTDIPPLYYFYAHEKPDYWVWIGGPPDWSVYEENGNLIYKYLGHTKSIASIDKLEEVIANTDNPIWIVMQYTYWDSPHEPEFRDCMKNLNAERVFVGEEPGAVVYHIH